MLNACLTTSAFIPEVDFVILVIKCLVTYVVSRVYSQQDVPAANFVMHEVHCARNITCCPKCKEPVPRATLEEHIEENHKLVNCKQCYEEMESCLLEEHMVSCCVCVYVCVYMCVCLRVCVHVCV